MKTKSINLIVRDALLSRKLPLHYYSRFLHHALTIVDELSLDFDLGNNVKTVELDVTSYQRAVLPADFVDVIDVSAKSGDKLLPLERDRSLNKKYNYDGNGNKIAFPSSESNSELNSLVAITSSTVNLNSRGELKGRYYGSKRVAKFTYDVDSGNEELVFGTDMDLTKVTLTYLTTGVSRSSANLVTPYANDTITKYIYMMESMNSKDRIGIYQIAKQDYNIARANLRARLNAMDTAEIIGALRRGIHGGLKN